MNKKTNFKEFVKNNPSLLKFVKEEKMTWQKFYEMYDLYGENHEVWNEYINKKEIKEEKNVSNTIGMMDVLTWLKSINLDKMQESISSVQRVLGVLEDLGSNNEVNTKPEYKPRPLYKHFED